jgi:hypothetical protein
VLGLTGGLIIGFALPVRARRFLAEAAPGGPAALGALLRIAPDDRVTVLVPHSEMGQGIEVADHFGPQPRLTYCRLAIRCMCIALPQPRIDIALMHRGCARSHQASEISTLC